MDKEAKRIQFRLLGLLGQGHNIIVHIRRLLGRTDEFRKLVGKLIPMNNRTRRNSQYKMLTILLNLRPVVEKYYADHEDFLVDDILSFQDQKKLCTIKDFLVPFSRATLTTKGDSTSIDSTLITIDILISTITSTSS